MAQICLGIFFKKKVFWIEKVTENDYFLNIEV